MGQSYIITETWKHSNIIQHAEKKTVFFCFDFKPVEKHVYPTQIQIWEIHFCQNQIVEQQVASNEVKHIEYWEC